MLAGAVLAVLAAALAWFGTRHLPVLRQGSAWLEDLQLAYFAQPRPQSDAVILLTIDENTLAELPFRSPISRAFLARVLRSLAAKKPSAVGIDILFDQPTIAEDDDALLAAIDSFPAPVVAVVGDASTGLTERQLEFQERYLDGRNVGSATVHTSDGVVREVFPGETTAAGFTPSLVAALAGALGVELAEPQRIYYRVRREGEPPPIRSFPAATAEHLPASLDRGPRGSPRRGSAESGSVSHAALRAGRRGFDDARRRDPCAVARAAAGDERYPAAPTWLEALIFVSRRGNRLRVAVHGAAPAAENGARRRVRHRLHGARVYVVRGRRRAAAAARSGRRFLSSPRASAAPTRGMRIVPKSVSCARRFSATCPLP